MSIARPHHALSRPTGVGLFSVCIPASNTGQPLHVQPGRLVAIAATASPRAAAVPYETPALYALDALAVRPVHGKGVGLFATRPLPAGARIMADPSLVRLLAGQDLPQLASVIDSLSQSKRALYYSLSAPEHNVRVERLVEKLRETGMPEAGVARLARVAAIFYANAFKLNDPSNKDSFGRLTGEVLFAGVARINHSCAPSAHTYCHHGPAGSTEMRVTMLRAVEPGQEITLAYFSPLESREARQDRARDWGFECQCDVCGESAPIDATDQDVTDQADGETRQPSDLLQAARAELELRRMRIRDLQDLTNPASTGSWKPGPVNVANLVALCKQEPALHAALPEALAKLAMHCIAVGVGERKYKAIFEEAAAVQARLTGADSLLAKQRRNTADNAWEFANRILSKEKRPQ